jgi:5,10-methylenetetrahydromethanopterin reductase
VPGPAFGVALPLDRPVGELVETAQEAERLGYEFVWANDDRLGRDPFIVLAAIARATERVRLGPGVTNPYSRHPALIAAALATLDELSAGRAVLGLGAGGTNHAMLGVDRAAPARTLRDAITIIRSLLRGEEVTLEGPATTARRARLDFAPSRADIPIFVGGRGPRILELAGEVADGVIFGNVATADGWRYALEHVATGAKRAGRTLDDLEVMAWLYCAIDDEESAALDAVRPMVATSLVTSRAILPMLGVELPEEFVALMEAARWVPSRASVDRAAPIIPEALIHRFALAGTPQGCRARLSNLLDDVATIGGVTIVPSLRHGQQPGDLLRRFIEDVAEQGS